MTKLYVCEISNLIDEIKEEPNALKIYFTKLGKMRIEHIMKHNRAEDRARALGASLLLLFAMQKTSFDIDTLPDFAYAEKGKPYFEQYSNLYFNLSHTKNIVTCVISDCEVGVDAEHVREMKDATINRVFSEKEKKMTGFSWEGYVRFWTIKEACAKLIGTGLSEIIDGLEIVVDENGTFVKKLKQDIRKIFCYKVIAEGQIVDSQNFPYYYSVCANKDSTVETIHVKWENHSVVYC